MPGAVFLEGDKVNLRTVEEEDLEFIRDAYNHPEVWPWLTHQGPQNLEQEREFFENVICSDDQINLAISDEETITGLISLVPKDEDCSRDRYLDSS
ncbi:MAG: GNAT family N-acetyltransferase [Candidatus Nanohalobium sp.]